MREEGLDLVYSIWSALFAHAGTPDAFLARADAPTMPIAIVRLLSQPGAASVGEAYAMATLLMLVTVLAVAALGAVALRQALAANGLESVRRHFSAEAARPALRRLFFAEAAR